MEKLRMGIVGAGIWGETHASIYNEHPFAMTVAICDQNRSKAEALAAKFGIEEIYTDYREMAVKSKCDAIAIVTPDFLHADIAIACAEAKKDLLIEKPLATTHDDVYRMMDSFEKNKVRVMVDLHNRWNPAVNTAKQLIDAGDLGTPTSAYGRLNDIKWVATDMLSWAGQSSILWFLGSHCLDTLRFLVGSEVERVYAVSREGILKKMGVDVPDMYQATLEFKNGAIAQMESGWITPNANTCINDIKFTVLGTDGMINIDCSSHNMIQEVTDHKVITPDIIVRNKVDGKVKGFAYESIRSFVDCILSERDFLVTKEDAANTSLALLAIMESAKTRQPMAVKY